MEIISLSNSDFDLNYLGESEYVKEHYITRNGYNLMLSEGLRNPVDYSISNGNFLTLTEQKNIQDVFEDIKSLKTGVDQGELSAVGQNFSVGQFSLSAIEILDSPKTIVGMQQGEDSAELTNYDFSTYIKIDTTFVEISGDNVSIKEYPNEDNLTNKNFLYLTFLDEIKCNIISNQNKDVKYLSYKKSSQEFLMLPFSDIEGDIDFVYDFYFSYNGEDDEILFLIPDLGIIAPDYDEETLKLEPLSSLDQNIFWNILPSNNLIGEIKLEQSYFSLYGLKNQVAKKYPVNNHSIITENFKSTLNSNSNFIPLKSSVIFDGTYGDVNINGDVFYRDYTSINSGPRGEYGYPNIILSYNNNQTKYEFNPNEITYFHIPSNLKGWKRININDTSLIQNGAVGGNSPLNSDKVFKYLYEYSDFKNTGKTISLDNGMYLCSWLFFNPVDHSKSIWLDRYYNPDKVKKLDALSESGWNFLSDIKNYVEENINLSDSEYSNYYKEFDKDIGVFDVESKLTFEPNVKYIYHHLGNDNSVKMFNELSESVLLSSEGFELDNESTDKIDIVTNYTEGDFTLSFTLNDFNIDSFKGNLIIGNDDYGLYFDESYTPFRIAYSGNILYIYDYNYVLFKTIELQSNVKFVIYLDSYKTFLAVDENNTIYSCSITGYIKNYTTEYNSENFIDYLYNDEVIYLLSDSERVYTFDINTLEANIIQTLTDGNLLIVDKTGNVNISNGDFKDYDSDMNYYILSGGDTIFKNDPSSVLVSSSNIKQMVIDSEDNLFTLVGDTIYKINQDNFTPTVLSSYTIDSAILTDLYITKVLENGQVREYLDVVENGGVTIYRFERDLSEPSIINLSASNLNFVGKSNYYNLKYADKNLKFKIKLRNIFNLEQVQDIVITVSESIIKESSSLKFNLILNNKFGNLSLYCNGRKIETVKFDPNQYSYMVTSDSKIFIGGDNIDEESFVHSVTPIMKSGPAIITDIYLHSKSLDYYDVINYNKRNEQVPPAVLILPIKTRGYIEEIDGFFIQNKNLRKSEFGRVDILAKGLTDDMKDKTDEFIKSLISDTFINNQISEINIYQDE